MRALSRGRRGASVALPVAVCVSLLAVLALLAPSAVSAHDKRADAPSLPLPDAPFEQVIADRYLFAGNEAECTAWPVLSLSSAWSVVAAPSFMAGADSGVWALGAQGQGRPAMWWLDTTAQRGGNISLATTGSTPLQQGDVLLALATGPNSPFTAALVSPTAVQLLACDRVDLCAVKQQVALPAAVQAPIRAAMFVPTAGAVGAIYIAADSGLHTVDLATLSVTASLHGIAEALSSLAYSAAHDVVFIGGATRLYIQSQPSQSNRWRFEEVTALIDSAISALTFDPVQARLWIGYTGGASTMSPVVLADGQTHWALTRLAGQVSDPGSDVGGLPFAQISTLGVASGSASDPSSDGRVWLGSARGLMRFDAAAPVAANRWRVFNSARYMPQRDALVSVSSLALLPRPAGAAALQGNTAVAITRKGLAVLRFEMWTLARKAAFFQSYFDQPARHSRYGLVGSCTTPVFGDTKQCVQEPSDNDGLWTSIYLSGAAWKFGATGVVSDWKEAWSRFEALSFLSEATGISGYPGRSFARTSEVQPDPKDWHPSSTQPGWQFKGDTSSDEITGHGMIYPLVAQLLATTAAERSLPLGLMLNITKNILGHDWYLVGESGNATRWGVWNPAQINDDPLWQEGRGTNSVQILSWLAQAFVATGADEFLGGIARLVAEPARYDANMVNQKMLAVCDSNFSDDELSYMAYFTLQHALNQWKAGVADPHSPLRRRLSTRQRARFGAVAASLESYMRVGLDLSHRYKVREKSPFYNSLYCFASGQVGAEFATAGAATAGAGAAPQFDCASLSADSVWYLQRWPLELLDWPQFNSDRLDVQLNSPARGCRADQQSLALLPPDERMQEKWNVGPFELDGGDGVEEDGPGTVLSGYWAMRFYGIISAPSDE